ncbi:MAG: hypothetical protein U0521_16315 [Anaerolineae bacterium]
MSTIHLGVIGLGRMGQVYANHAAPQIKGRRWSPSPTCAGTDQGHTPDRAASPCTPTITICWRTGLDAVIVATPTTRRS